jgi:hypothetical protein
MRTKRVAFFAVVCLILFLVLWGCWKYNLYVNSKAGLFVVSTEDCGWNTITGKPTRINGLNNVWQIKFDREGKNLVAFGNCEQPTKHWETGDQVLIVGVPSNPSIFSSQLIYFFIDHKKK